MKASGLRQIVVVLVLGFAVAARAATPASEPERAIRAALEAQAAAWNRGDIDAFMQGYWHDQTLRFASGDTVTYGWQATLEHYRARYPDKTAMGRLSFADLDVELLGRDAALVFGHWSLARAEDNPHGLFTLLLRKTPDGWKVTRDHTSSAQ